MLLRPTPVMPLVNVRFEGSGDVDSVPRVYIRTLKDQLMSQKAQEEMINNWPPSKVFAVGSDHSAFLSTPDAVFRYLLEAATSF
ncbi:hypothetical protein L484_000350 [Morus notabilis]|uniref:Uncharacterized protein n=1 Tax=Morus notabilis TaxID=981085 RepID=W9SF83_9ROSA|nr:hypothetical protein L484_000350 [Morus notabilis]